MHRLLKKGSFATILLLRKSHINKAMIIVYRRLGDKKNEKKLENCVLHNDGVWRFLPFPGMGDQRARHDYF